MNDPSVHRSIGLDHRDRSIHIERAHVLVLMFTR